MNKGLKKPSINREEFFTPRWLFDKYDGIYNFTTDACTSENNPLGCKVFFTKKMNGCNYKKWKGESVWINPPYSGDEIDVWIEQAVKYTTGNNKVVCMLLPAFTDRKWFHKYISHYKRIDFIEGRVRFLDKDGNKLKHSARFGSMVIII